MVKQYSVPQTRLLVAKSNQKSWHTSFMGNFNVCTWHALNKGNLLTYLLDIRHCQAGTLALPVFLINHQANLMGRYISPHVYTSTI